MCMQKNKVTIAQIALWHILLEPTGLFSDVTSSLYDYCFHKPGCYDFAVAYRPLPLTYRIV
jgi:hypothetical protein